MIEKWSFNGDWIFIKKLAFEHEPEYGPDKCVNVLIFSGSSNVEYAHFAFLNGIVYNRPVLNTRAAEMDSKEDHGDFHGIADIIRKLVDHDPLAGIAFPVGINLKIVPAFCAC